MSKKELDRLGDRLRDAAVPSEEDLRLLEAVRPHYLAALERVRVTLRDELGLDVVHREKNRDTIIEKLRREPEMRFSRVQDIVGARVVRAMTLSEQDELVARIAVRLPEVRIRDRRLEPSFGYRAVHLVVKLDGIPVEIQVRTDLQHGWAQSMERVGDAWGRAVRYGGQPEDPARLHGIMPGGVEKSRSEWVEILKDLSALIAAEEQSTGDKATMVSVPGVPGSFTLGQLLDFYLAARL